MIGIFTVIAAPWYLLAAQVNGMEFLGTFFGFSNFQRFTNVIYRHAGPWYFYLPWCFMLLLPWSLFLPLALARLQIWRRKAWVTSPREQQLGLFCGFWVILILLFFSSAATKLAGYILPLVPGGAILVSLLAAELWVTAPQKPSPLHRWPFLGTLGLNGLLLAVMAITAYLSPQLVANDPATPEFGSLLSASGLPIIFSAILALGAIAVAVLLGKPPWRKGWWIVNIATYLLVLILVIPPLAPLLDSQIQQPSRLVAIAAKDLIQPGEPIFVMGYKRYSVVYYSQHPAVFLDDVHYAWEIVEQQDPNQSSDTVLLIGEKRTLDRFNLQPSDYQDLSTAFPYHLWRVDKQTLLQRKPA
jgi:4-amino-4-deoxy-L-arabinose transferase-like glycosyltransferase